MLFSLSRLRARTLGFIAAGGVAAALVAVPLAGSASAAPIPPLHPQSFTINIGNSGNGFGQAFGSVRGLFRYESTGADTAVASFRNGVVKLTHEQNGPVTQPRLNRFCSGFQFTQGQWQMRGLAGRDARAFGFGEYDAWTTLQGVRFPNGHCGNVRAQTFVWAWGESANPQPV
jgi:hypothetical protein